MPIHMLQNGKHPLPVEHSAGAMTAGLQESLISSEALNMHLLEMFPYPVSIIGMADSRFLMVNPIWCKMAGLPKNRVIGQTVEELGLFNDPADGRKIRALLERDGEVKNFESHVQRKGLPPLHLQMWIRKIRHMSQDCMLSVTSFASPENEFQQSLFQSDMRFRTLLNSINDSYYETDLQGRLTFFNDSLAALLNCPPEKVKGIAYKTYTSEEDARKLEQTYKAIISGKSKFELIEFGLHRRDGKLLQVETSVGLLRDNVGRPVGFSGIVRDRTEQKAAETAIRRSEEKYRRILEEMEEGYYEVDLDGHFTFVNEAMVKIHGYGPHELIGMSFKQYLHPDRAAIVHQLYVNVYKTGNPVLIHDYEIIKKDGAISLLEISGYPMRDQDGQIVGFWGISRDRTEQRKAEKALGKSEEQYRLLVDHATDGIYITQDQRIQFHNPKTCEITGYSDKELAGMAFADLVHPNDLNAIYAVQKQKLEAGHSPDLFAFRIINKNRQVLWVELIAIGITWEGRPATLNFLRDVTHIKKTEDRLLQAQKMEAIGTLAGGIAHDFNNILSAILGYTELSLDDAPKGSMQHNNLKEVVNASHRAKDLVHQILAFARQSEEKVKPVIMSIIAKEVLKLIRSSIPTTIEIRHNISSKSQIMGTPTQVHQILMNLCTNAAHAMEKSGGILRVDLTDCHLTAAQANLQVDLADGDYLKLSVSDTGCGIAPEIRNFIFDPYFTTKGLGEGTGMGLSVVQGIVENYGGKITVDSEAGKGTAFTVYLPISDAKAAPPARQVVDLPACDERILLVDDEVTIIKMADQILEKLGYRVTPQTDSLEALKQFAEKPDSFDLVLTDMTMPNLTGEQLAREMMRIRPDIPVILCTGYSKQINKESALKMGIKAFVYKPIDRSDLALTIRRVLNEAGKDTTQ